jgi:hypothetical protein
MDATCFCYACHELRVILVRVRETQMAVKDGNQTQIEGFMNDLKRKVNDLIETPCIHNPER